MNQVYIALGSNLGNREAYLRKAVQHLQGVRGVHLLAHSKIYETEPVGGPEQGKYCNAACEIACDLEPAKLLEKLLEIEVHLGRIRGEPNGPRTIDLDILFFGRRVFAEPGLHIPHPRLHERLFVLEPLCDLNPKFEHPVFKTTVGQLRERLLESYQENQNVSMQAPEPPQSIQPYPEQSTGQSFTPASQEVPQSSPPEIYPSQDQRYYAESPQAYSGQEKAFCL